MKLTQIAAGVAIAMAASVASADYVSIGFDENEIYKDTDRNNYAPSVQFGFSPLADSPLMITGHFRENLDDASDERHASDNRQQIGVSYSLSSGDFTVAPDVAVRREGTEDDNKVSYRFTLNNAYQVNEDLRAYLNFFTFTRKAIAKEQTASKKYSALETTLGANYALTSTNNLDVYLFNAKEKDKAISAEYNFWRVGTSLSHKFNDALSGNVFARYTFKENDKKAGVTTDTGKDWRLGVGLNYAINEDWSIGGNAFYTQDYKTYDTGSKTAEQNKEDSKKYVYSLWFTRSF